MTSQHDKAKRWRPKFSVRTLVIVVTLVCCYAACWGPTKKWGEEDLFAHYEEEELFAARRAVSSRLPLIVEVCCVDLEALVSAKRRGRSLPQAVPPMPKAKRHYYFWFFGYVAKLPYEREVELPVP
jgi:hypothetical protein